MCSDVCSEGLESWSASFFLTHITTDRSYVAGKPANKVPTDEWKPLHEHVKGAVHPKKKKSKDRPNNISGAWQQNNWSSWGL